MALRLPAPWVDSSDAERLDGANGLMLRPHIDHLFDRATRPFEDNGKLLVRDAQLAAVLNNRGY